MFFVNGTYIIRLMDDQKKREFHIVTEGSKKEKGWQGGRERKGKSEEFGSPVQIECLDCLYITFLFCSTLSSCLGP